MIMAARSIAATFTREHASVIAAREIRFRQVIVARFRRAEETRNYNNVFNACTVVQSRPNNIHCKKVIIGDTQVSSFA